MISLHRRSVQNFTRVHHLHYCIIIAINWSHALNKPRMSQSHQIHPTLFTFMNRCTYVNSLESHKNTKQTFINKTRQYLHRFVYFVGVLLTWSVQCKPMMIKHSILTSKKVQPITTTKIELINAVWGNNRCLHWESHATDIYTLWAKLRITDCWRWWRI